MGDSRALGEGRAYPHDLAAERAVLGAILISPDVLVQVRATVNDVDFYLEKHRKVFGRMLALHDAGTPVDVLTVAESFRRNDQLEEVGGLAYLSALLESVPITANVVHYAKIVKEKALLRLLLQVTSEISEKVLEGEGSATDLVSAAGTAIATLGRLSVVDTWLMASDVAREAFAELDGSGKQGSGGTPIDCGIPLLDTRTTELRVIGARTSMGKTALAHQLLLSAATRGVPCGVITMETTARQLGRRALGCLGRCDVRQLMGWLNSPRALSDQEASDSEHGWLRLAQAAESLYALPVGYYDQKTMTVEELGGLMAMGRDKHGFRHFMIDYLQKIRVSPALSRERHDVQLGHVTSELKALALDLDVSIDLLCQINRGVEARASKRPLVSDLRDSGRIEEDADVILLLYREGYYAIQEARAKQMPGSQPADEATLPTEIRRHAEVIIGKDRNHGRAGKTVQLAWFAEWQRFEQLARPWEEEP